jgi:hypothetical protein
MSAGQRVAVGELGPGVARLSRQGGRVLLTDAVHWRGRGRGDGSGRAVQCATVPRATLQGGGDMTDSATRWPRWRPFISFAVLFALVALLLPVFQRPPSKGIRACFDQIQNGMTEEQVEELLGGPRGIYDKTRWYSNMTAIGAGSGRSHLSWWYFPDCAIEVGFDEDGRVNGKRIEPSTPQSLFERVVRWCKQTFPSLRPGALGPCPWAYGWRYPALCLTTPSPISASSFWTSAFR